jgi:uncharacterized delta-60 repeat protein
MSRIIKIQSLKNGSNVIKIKTIANEKYIITDETGKPLNKLKFVQKNKNLEIYTEVDGKEQQVVTLEDYYSPDMKASVVGLGETSEELAYVYNANDGWSYLELPETAFGFATPLLGLGAAGAAGAGIAAAGGGGGSDGNSSNTSSDTTPPATPTTAISSYDDNVGAITNTNSTATSTDDTTPGFNVGAIPSDANSIVLYVNGVEVASTYNSTTGTLTPNTPLTEGTYSITYAYKDINGNTSTQSPAFSLTVDTPPVAPTIEIKGYDDNVGAITNTNSIATTTDDATPGFNVGAIPSDANSIVLYVDGVEVPATYDSLNETLTPNTPLTDGTYDITYAYKDATGNTSAQSPAFSLTVETIPTATVVLNKTALKIGETATLTITFSEVPSNFVEADDLTLEHGTLSGGSFDVTGKIYTATFIPTANIEDSTNVITLGTSWSDSSNNAPASTSVSGNVAIDTIAPNKLTITLDTDSGTSNMDGNTNIPTMNISGLESGASWQYKIGAGVWQNGIGSSFELSEGTYSTGSIQVKQIDVSGNESLVSSFPPPLLTEGDSSITLSNGWVLREPLQVEGKWYYLIDTNGNGTVESADRFTLEAMKANFNSNEANTATNATIDHTYRYFHDGIVTLAIPTLGVAGLTSLSGDMTRAGTSVNSPDVNNPTYDDLYAIWDAHTTGGAWTNGMPPSWSTILSSSYVWSSTPGTFGGTGAFLFSGGYVDASYNVGTPSAINYMVVELNINGGYTNLVVDQSGATFTSNATASIIENTVTTTVVYDANATDNGGANDVGITYSISGGADANKFTINSAGEVRFVTSPDYENPTDVGGNNVYDIIIRATDSAGNSTDKNVAINVTDIFELPTATVALNKTALKVGETATLTITFSEVPSNFVDADDLTLEHGTLSGGSFDVTGKIYTATFIPTANIEDSTNVITLGTSWSDSSNNAPASTSVSGNVAIDTIAPATLSLTLNTDTGISSIDGYTSNGLVDVTGIEVGNTWKYSIDGGTTWIDGVGSSFILPDDTYGINDIQVKQIDASGNEVITSEIKGNALSTVKLDGITTAGQEEFPQITTLSDGSYVVTWSGIDTNGNYSIYVQKFNADGSITGNNPVTLEGIPTGYDVGSQITALANGEYAVTWTGYTPDWSTTSIYVQKFNSNGTITGNNPVSLDGIPTGNDSDSKITTLSDGSCVVTWQGIDINGSNSIFVQKFNANGTITGNNPVTLEGIPTGQDSNSQITILSNGSYVVTWYGTDTNGDNSIFVQKFNADGTITGNNPVTLSGNPTVNDQAPQITSLLNGEYVVTWHAYTPDWSTSSVYVQKFNANGTIIGNNPVTLEGIPTGQNSNSQITTLSDGNYVVTWYGIDTNGSNSIFVQKFNADGTITGNTPAKLDGIPSGQDYNPQITTLSDGSYVVTWHGQDTNGDSSIFVQKFNVDGTITGNNPVKLEGIPTGTDEAAQITALANGGYVVTWSGYTLDWSDTSIFVQQFDAKGIPIKVNLTNITVDSGIPNTPIIDTIATDDIVNASEQSSAITGTCEAGAIVSLSIGGNVREVTVTGTTWSYTLTGADITAMGQGTETITATQTDQGGNTSVVPASKDITVDTTAPDFPIINVQSPQVKLEGAGNTNTWDSNPQITAVGTAGEYLVTFKGVYNGHASVFIQKFNADGTTQGSQVMFKADINSSYEEFPQITTVGNSGEYVVACIGNLAGDYSIYVQKYNADGTTQGLPVKLDPTSYPYSPQITAVGTAGEYVVTYYGGDSNGDDSIYVQKFNANGTTLGSQVILEATGVSTGNDTFSKVTAIGNSGEYIVIYRGVDTDGDTSIFIQKFNSNGTTQGAQVILEPIGITNGYDNEPQIIAIGTSGEYVVTWFGDDSNGDESIFVQKFNANGTTQGAQVMFEATGITNQNEQSPQITAVGNNGEYVVAYFLNDSGTYSSIYVQKFNSDGTTEGTQVKLDASGVTNGIDLSPQITELNNGEYVVTWSGRDTNNDFSIFVQKFNANGTTQGTQSKLEPIGITNRQDYEPQVTAVGTSGEFVVTWYGDYDANYSVFVQKFNADGTPANLVEAVTVVENTATTAVVYDANATDNGGANDVGITYSISGGADANKFTINSAGEVRFVTSPDYENPTDVGGNNVYDIIIRATDSAGNTTNKSVAINVTNIIEPTLSMSMTPSSGFASVPTKLDPIGNGNDIFPEITTLSDGSYVVTWYGTDTNGSYSIFVQKFNADGTITGNNPVTLEGIPSGQDYAPQITSLSDGSYIVTWYGIDTNGSHSIFVQKFNSNGTITGNNPVTLEGISTGQDSGSQITTLSDGSYVVTWQGTDINGSHSIFVQKFNSNGTITGNNPVTLEGISSGQDTVPQITALANGEYAVTWRGSDVNSGTVVYVQKFNSDGTITGNPVVTHGGIGYSNSDPQIATLSDGSYVVTSHGNNMNIAILVQKFNADGTTTGNSMVTLNGFSTTWNEKSQITPLSDGSYAVTWTEYDTSWGFTSVYVQKFNVDGTITGNAIVKLEGVLNGNSVAPQIIGLDDGSYVVTYDGRDVNGDNSIFVQKFNANGTTSGNQVMLEPTGVTNLGDYAPKVTALVGGGYAVTWYGYDESGDNSVFVQQFDANGIPVNSSGATTGDLKITTTFTLNDFETMNGYKVTYTQGSLTVDGTTYATGSTVAQSTWETAVANGTVILSGVSSSTYNLIIETIATDTQTGSTLTLTDTKMGIGMVSPMMLDLDGKGVNTSSFDNGVIFDVNADGIIEQTGWSDGKDGLLALDLNKDGIINDGSELFGQGTTLADGSKAKDAFEALKQYDENGDNVIDSNDSIFASLQIWVDKNIDGKTNSDELYKLEDLNVKFLDLNSQNSSSVDNGNIQGLVSNWTDTNDNSHEMVDVWFKTQEVSQNTISETSAWTTSTVSEVNNQSYVVYANTQIVIDEESKSQYII